MKKQQTWNFTKNNGAIIITYWHFSGIPPDPDSSTCKAALGNNSRLALILVEHCQVGSGGSPTLRKWALFSDFWRRLKNSRYIYIYMLHETKGSEIFCVQPWFVFSWDWMSLCNFKCQFATWTQPAAPENMFLQEINPPWTPLKLLPVVLNYCCGHLRGRSLLTSIIISV